MECYVLTLIEKRDIGTETNVIGVYENEEDIHSLMMRYYLENPSNFEERSMNQYEDSRGEWVFEIKGRKDQLYLTLRAEYKSERITGSIKELFDDLKIEI